MSTILRSQRVYDGYASVTLLTLADDDGEHQREVVSFGHSACVLPYDPVRKVALIVRLPRAPLLLDGIETPLIEAPAGMIEAGEGPEATARREAMEEAGVELGDLELVGACWPSPGVIAERSHLYLAPYARSDVTGPGGGLAEEHEGISAEELPISELWTLQAAGSLQDMKTLNAGLGFAQPPFRAFLTYSRDGEATSRRVFTSTWSAYHTLVTREDCAMG